MREKIKTIFWFLKNPRYLPQIIQILKRNKNSHLEDTRAEATNWCKQNCISQEKALKKLTGKSSFKSINILYPDEIKQAKNTAFNCPVKMGGEGAISFLYHLVKEKKFKNIFETGVAYGWSSLAILLAIEDTEGSRLISNDMPYVKMNNEDYVGCVVSENYKSKWELQRQSDVKGIPLALKKFNHNIDLCHYDSDKSYSGRKWSSPVLWSSLRKGGVFISDDINDNIAFKQFCNDVNRTPIIVEHLGKYVGVIKK